MKTFLIIFLFFVTAYGIEKPPTCVQDIIETGKRDWLPKFLVTRQEPENSRFPQLIEAEQSTHPLYEAYKKIDWGNPGLPFAVFKHLDHNLGYWNLAGKSPQIFSYYDWARKFLVEPSPIDDAVILHDQLSILSEDEIHFITNKVTQADLNAMKRSLIFKDGLLTDIREVSQVRIYFENSPVPIIVDSKDGEGLAVSNQKPGGVVSDFLGGIFGKSFFRLLLFFDRRFSFNVIDTLDNTLFAAINTAMEKHAKDNPVCIEFFHTTPSESILVQGEPTQDAMVYATYSADDKVQFNRSKKWVSRYNLPIVFSTMSGLHPSRFTKEYLIIPPN